MTQQAGVGDEKHGTGPVIADYDHNGWLDIYIANWGRSPSLLNPNPAPKTNVLYRNRGDGTFEETTDAAGVVDDGIAWGAIFFDYNGDTWADLFVANDHGPDKLYRNRGDGTFADVSEQSGIVTEIDGRPTGAMGLCVGDYDNDTDLDFFITEAENVAVAVEPVGKQSTTWGKIKAAEVFQNYPNPFNPETWIPYRLSESTDVQITIYAQNGELIRDFNLGQQSHGEKTLYWDGKNRDGETVASGIYFYRFRAGDTQSVRKMWLLK